LEGGGKRRGRAADGVDGVGVTDGTRFPVPPHPNLSVPS
jgi:hypothetical protein